MGSVALDEPVEDRLGPIAVFPRQAGSEGGVLAIAPVSVDDRYPAGRPGGGIDSDDRNRPYRGRQQQIGQIGLKQFQCFVVGFFLQIGSNFGLEQGFQGVEPGIPDGFLQMGNAGGIGLADQLVPDQLKRFGVVQFDFKGQKPFPGAAPQRRQAVKGDPGNCFAVVVEAFVPALFSLVSFNDP